MTYYLNAKYKTAQEAKDSFKELGLSRKMSSIVAKQYNSSEELKELYDDLSSILNQDSVTQYVVDSSTTDFYDKAFVSNLHRLMSSLSVKIEELNTENHELTSDEAEDLEKCKGSYALLNKIVFELQDFTEKDKGYLDAAQEGVVETISETLVNKVNGIFKGSVLVDLKTASLFCNKKDLAALEVNEKEGRVLKSKKSDGTDYALGEDKEELKVAKYHDSVALVDLYDILQNIQNQASDNFKFACNKLAFDGTVYFKQKSGKTSVNAQELKDVIVGIRNYVANNIAVSELEDNKETPSKVYKFTNEDGVKLSSIPGEDPTKGAPSYTSCSAQTVKAGKNVKLKKLLNSDIRSVVLSDSDTKNVSFDNDYNDNYNIDLNSLLILKNIAKDDKLVKQCFSQDKTYLKELREVRDEELSSCKIGKIEHSDSNVSFSLNYATLDDSQDKTLKFSTKFDGLEILDKTSFKYNDGHSVYKINLDGVKNGYALYTNCPASIYAAVSMCGKQAAINAAIVNYSKFIYKAVAANENRNIAIKFINNANLSVTQSNDGELTFSYDVKQLTDSQKNIVLSEIKKAITEVRVTEARDANKSTADYSEPNVRLSKVNEKHVVEFKIKTNDLSNVKEILVSTDEFQDLSIANAANEAIQKDKANNKITVAKDELINSLLENGNAVMLKLNEKFVSFKSKADKSKKETLESNVAEVAKKEEDKEVAKAKKEVRFENTIGSGPYINTVMVDDQKIDSNRSSLEAIAKVEKTVVAKIDEAEKTRRDEENRSKNFVSKAFNGVTSIVGYVSSTVLNVVKSVFNTAKHIFVSRSQEEVATDCMKSLGFDKVEFKNPTIQELGKSAQMYLAAAASVCVNESKSVDNAIKALSDNGIVCEVKDNSGKNVLNAFVELAVKDIKELQSVESKEESKADKTTGVSTKLDDAQSVKLTAPSAAKSMICA